MVPHLVVLALDLVQHWEDLPASLDLDRSRWIILNIQSRELFSDFPFVLIGYVIVQNCLLNSATNFYFTQCYFLTSATCVQNTDNNPRFISTFLVLRVMRKTLRNHFVISSFLAIASRDLKDRSRWQLFDPWISPSSSTSGHFKGQ